MTTNFPTSIDTPTNPQPGDPRNNPSLSALIKNLQDGQVAIETKVGVNGSVVSTTLDYKVSEITGTDKGVGKTAAQTLSNKTLDDPQINMGSDVDGDMYYRDSNGDFQRLPAGAAGTILAIDANGLPSWVPNPAAADATYATKGVRVIDAEAIYYAADAGSTDDYAITLSPAPSAYVAGQTFKFKANTANVGPATLNVSAIAAHPIVKGLNTPLITGDIIAGMICTVVYDLTNTQFVLQSSSANAVNPVNTKLSTLAISQAVATATLTKIADFTGLAGDTDDIYDLDFEIVGTQDSANSADFLFLRFNGSTGNYTYALIQISDASATLANSVAQAAAASGIPLLRGSSAINVGAITGHARIKASKLAGSAIRSVLGEAFASSGASAGTTGQARSSGTWSDVTNQITSVQLWYIQNSGSPSTVTGSATLSKIVR